jgi:uncharacterized membrane protein
MKCIPPFSCEYDKQDMTSAGNSLYVRALVFCTVMIVACVALLGAVMMGLATDFRWLFLTIQVGILMVVISTMVSVYQAQKLARERAQGRLDDPVTTCPDYWTRDRNQNCSNTYTTPDKSTRYVIGGGRQASQGVVLGQRVRDACASDNRKDADYPWLFLRARCNPSKR